jgi:type IV pilus assembly protein PilC
MSALTDRSQFYDSLATLVSAGLPMLRALDQRFPRRFRKPARQLLRALQDGETLSRAMRGISCFSNFECNLISAGEHSGQLDGCFRALSDWFALRQRLRQKVIGGMLYPLLMYHIAGPILAVVDVATGQLSMSEVAVRLILWYAAPWTAFILLRALLPGFFRSRPVGVLLGAVPLLGAVQFNLENASFFRALSLCLDAGIGMVSAIKLAAGSCSNRAYGQRFLRIASRIDKHGESFTEAYHKSSSSRERRSSIPALVDSGEISGTLDASAQRIASYCAGEGERQLDMLALMAPKALYGCLLLYIGYRIVSFYAAYFGQITELLQ